MNYLQQKSRIHNTDNGFCIFWDAASLEMLMLQPEHPSVGSFCTVEEACFRTHLPPASPSQTRPKDLRSWIGPCQGASIHKTLRP